MDIDLAGWIVEFLLRQKSVDDRLLNVLIGVLPLPDNNPSLKKGLILRKIESDVDKGTISERILEFLEQIEELDRREGIADVSEAMKAAYTAVAVHCTCKYLRECSDDKAGKYFSAVKRIWRGRVSEMAKFNLGKKIGLVSEDLLNWMNDIETGVWDLNFCDNLLAKCKGLDVVQLVRAYIEEAKQIMGPTFLELAAQNLSDDAIRKMMSLDEDGEAGNKLREDAATVVPSVGVNPSSMDNEPSRANVSSRCKHIANKRPRRVAFKTHMARIVDTEEALPNKYNSIPTPEVNKVQETLETSTAQLHAVVKDPLPDALCLAESFKSTIGGGSRVDAVVAPNCSKTKGPECSLMERNSTAHTIEWSDSIECSEGDSPIRPHLPSPVRNDVSPLKKYEDKKLVRTRKKKRWTTIEEDTLRTGVQKYGRGNWKLILTMYRDIFEDRTECDLKDKWRNLIR